MATKKPLKKEDQASQYTAIGCSLLVIGIANTMLDYTFSRILGVVIILMSAALMGKAISLQRKK